MRGFFLYSTCVGVATGDLKESKTPVLLGWGVDDEVRFPSGGNSLFQSA
jgi:hypothetical protein